MYSYGCLNSTQIQQISDKGSKLRGNKKKYNTNEYNKQFYFIDIIWKNKIKFFSKKKNSKLIFLFHYFLLGKLFQVRRIVVSLEMRARFYYFLGTKTKNFYLGRNLYNFALYFNQCSLWCVNSSRLDQLAYRD